MASNKFQPSEALKYCVWWKRDNAGVAERLGEQLRKTSVPKKCEYRGEQGTLRVENVKFSQERGGEIL